MRLPNSPTCVCQAQTALYPAAICSCLLFLLGKSYQSLRGTHVFSLPFMLQMMGASFLTHTYVFHVHVQLGGPAPKPTGTCFTRMYSASPRTYYSRLRSCFANPIYKPYRQPTCPHPRPRLANNGSAMSSGDLNVSCSARFCKRGAAPKNPPAHVFAKHTRRFTEDLHTLNQRMRVSKDLGAAKDWRAVRHMRLQAMQKARVMRTPQSSGWHHPIHLLPSTFIPFRSCHES